MKTKTALLLLVLMLLLGAALPAAAQQYVPNYDVTVYSTAQRFEGGLMLWRSDNSYIWVLLNDGTVQRFPSWRYSRLPDNTIVPPPGRIVPLFGFGKIWANYSGLRQQLGYPVQPELGFDMRIQYVSGIFMLQQLDRTVYQVNPQGTWNFTGSPQPQPPTPIPTDSVTSTYAAFQQFEHGFMIWRADNGTIYTFYNGGNGGGSFGTFVQSGYGALPDNPIFDIPTGFVRPINGFGRVWGNNDLVRQVIGQAVSGEQGYNLSLGSTQGVLNTLTTPDGRTLLVQLPGSWWRF